MLYLTDEADSRPRKLLWVDFGKLHIFDSSTT